MTDLESLLKRAIECNSYGYGYRSSTAVAISNRSTFMVMPLTEEKFELPVFALNDFTHVTHPNPRSIESLVAKLEYQGHTSTYKSLDARIRNLFLTPYRENRLCKLDAVGDEVYYITLGAIFDRNFNPIMMFTWEIEKKYEDNGQYYLSLERPILRVDPEIYVSKRTPVERYIVNKIIPKSLGIHTIYRPYTRINTLFKGNDWTSSEVKVIIDKNPFILKHPDTPSISTTNRDLLDVALNNIEEVI